MNVIELDRAVQAGFDAEWLRDWAQQHPAAARAVVKALRLKPEGGLPIYVPLSGKSTSSQAR